ncbi:MAG: hypothetical protein KDC92_17355, partial [Bacteroidetes bacterium]|nr:hypothetical protein [Bacteroidota bacterium]
DSINIYRLSIGMWTLEQEPRFTNTNGIKLELVGVGLLIPIIPKSPIVTNERSFKNLLKKPLSERINGLNISTMGSWCDCKTNGLVAGLMAQIHREVNGISTVLYMNFTQKHNGLMLAMFNDSYKMNGLQIGLGNNGYRVNGLQIGLIGNHAYQMHGLQIGIYNMALDFKGLQLGIWNVNDKRKLPFINWSF